MPTKKTARLRVLAVLAAASALVITDVGVATATPRHLPIVPLTNSQEPVEVDAQSAGAFSYVIRGSKLCYVLRARNLTGPAEAAHIHVAPRDVAGPVVVPLIVGAGTSWTVATCTEAAPDLLQQIRSNPSDYYVNVHTPAYPAGEIRGQLR